MSIEPRAITFDFWNTLIYEPPGHLAELRMGALRRAFAELETPMDVARLEATVAEVGRLHEDEWRAGRQLGPERAADMFVERLGQELSAAGRESVRTAFLDAGASAELELAPGIEDSLRSLRAAGIRLGIVCDVGLTGSPLLRAFLDRRGLLELFDGWAFSDEVGHYKPSPIIFEHALGALSAAPENAMHVGDLRRTDVAGARAMGMTAVRYRGIADDPASEGPEADHVLDHHRELSALIAAGGTRAS